MDWLSQFYHTEIADTGRLPLFLLLAGMLLAFLLIRVNTRLIRAQVRWWPGNLEHGDVHLHHVVFGLPVMFATTVVEFAFRPGRPWVEILALAFGAAAGLAFDEFALILHLEDVYWTERGRKSVVAVFLGITFAAFLLVGVVPLGALDPRSVESASRWSVAIIVLANIGFVVVSFLKGKLWMGWIGFFIPMVAWTGALRLARPQSPWARWRYAGKPRKLERAEAREQRFASTVGSWRLKLADVVAGAPHKHHHGRDA